MTSECMAARCMAAATRPLVVDEQEYTPSMARFDDLLRRIGECKVTQDFLSAEQTQSLGLVVENLDSWPPDALPYFAPATEAELLAGMRAVCREEEFYDAWTEWDREISADSERRASLWATFLDTMFSKETSEGFSGEPYDVVTGGTTLQSATRWGALFDGFGDDYWAEPLVQSYPPAQEGEPEKWELVSSFAAKDQSDSSMVGPPHVWALLAYDVPFDDRVSSGELCCIVTIIRDRLLGTEIWSEADTNFPVLLFVTNMHSVRMIQACWDHQRLHLRRTPGMRLVDMSDSDFSEHDMLLRWMMAMPVHPPTLAAMTTALTEGGEEADTPSMLHFDDLTRRWSELDPTKADFLTEKEENSLDLVVENLDLWPTTASLHFGLATEAELLEAIRAVCGDEDTLWKRVLRWNATISDREERSGFQWAEFLNANFSRFCSTDAKGEPYDKQTGGVTLKSSTLWGALIDGFDDPNWSAPLLRYYPPNPQGQPQKWRLVSHCSAKESRSSLRVGMPHVLTIVAYDVAFDDRISFGELSCVTTIIRERIAARELWPAADCNVPVLLFMTNMTGVRMVQAHWDDFRLHLVRTPEMRLERMTASDCADHRLLLRWMMATPLDPAAGR